MSRTRLIGVGLVHSDPGGAGERKERNWQRMAFRYVHAQKSHSLPTENKRAREREWESSQAETERARGRVKEVGRARQRRKIREKETCSYASINPHTVVKTTFDIVCSRGS